MIRTIIQAVDGDSYPMMFSCWAELGEWMQNNQGKFTGVHAELANSGRREHDNDGTDPRITRLG